MYIILEGPDRAGKTTTRRLVHEIRNYKDNILDRFIGSMIVYGKIFNRYDIKGVKKQYKEEKKFAKIFNTALVYLYASKKSLAERIKKDKHEKIDNKILGKTIKEYDEYFERSVYKSKIKIDTSKYNQKEVASKIVNFLEKIENK